MHSTRIQRKASVVTQTDKSKLRQTYCTIREDLGETDVIDRSTAVHQRLAEMAVLTEADTVMAYLAFRNEIDLRPLFGRLPDIRWVLPRIEGKRMILHPYEPERLVRHAYGMLEPRADAPTVAPEEVDVVLVPGVSFDSHGGRLGFGGGFYDRFLAQIDATRFGVCYDCCLAEGLPCAAHDQRMDWVVTPTAAIHCTPLWRRECEPTSPGS